MPGGTNCIRIRIYRYSTSQQWSEYTFAGELRQSLFSFRKGCSHAEHPFLIEKTECNINNHNDY